LMPSSSRTPTEWDTTP